jgi:hypothetical protein
MSFSKIILTSSDTPNAVPDATDLSDGELALNFHDGKLYFKDSTNTISNIASRSAITSLDNHISNNNNPHNVTASQVGLGSVDNTSDLAKPVSNLTQSALNLKANATELTAHENDVANPHSVSKTQVGLGSVDNTSDLTKPVSNATQSALDLKANSTELTAHENDVANPHNVSKTQVGLGSVDNTSDLAKPVSNLTQSALDLKANSTDVDSAIINHIELADLSVGAEAAASGNGSIVYDNTVGVFTYTPAELSGLGAGTIATQDHDSVNIDGGTLDGVAIAGSTLDDTSIGGNIASSAKFTEIIVDPTATAGNYTKGAVRWNDVDRTLEFDNGDDDVTIQIGQETHFRVHNNTGSTILNGSAVKIVGSANGFPTIALAQADSNVNVDGIVGISTHDIEDGTEGTVTILGSVRGIDTSAFSIGDRVYLSSTNAGEIAPTNSVISISLGYVTVAHATSGEMLVNIQSDVPRFGGIFLDQDDSPAPALLTLSSTYQKVASFTQNSLNSDSISDVSNNQLVLSQGVWDVSSNLSVSCSLGTTTYTLGIFLDGVLQPHLQAQHYIKDIGNPVTIPLSGHVYVSSGTKTLDVRIKVQSTDGTPDATFIYGALTTHRIS